MLIEKIKKTIEQYSVLFKNFSYLAILQVFTLAIPLITLPYLFRVFGEEIYGTVVFAQAITAFLAIIVAFGFNISATKEVSIHRNDSSKLSEIVSSVFILKLLLFLLTIIILTILAYFVPIINQNKTLFYLSGWICLYEFIFPIWFFQGVEKMQYITIINVISRTLSLVLIFTLIRSPEDYLYYPLINGIAAILSGSISFYIVFGINKVEFNIQPYKHLKYYFIESYSIFIAKISQLYIILNKIIIGTLIGVEAVAYFDISEKIISVLKMPISMISQTVFPKNAKDKDIKFIFSVFKITLFLELLLMLLVIIFAPLLVKLISGEYIPIATQIIRILSLTLIPITINNSVAIQTLLAFGYQKLYMRSIIAGSTGYLVLIILLFGFGNGSLYLFGIAVIIILAESITSCLSLFYAKKYIYNYIKSN